jgi:tetraacyldisaccharide 4'-kinase
MGRVPAVSGPARWAETIWYGRSAWSICLLPVAWLFGLVVRVRRACYQRGLLRSHAISAPVIVVGNITVGGTGKTPVVEWLVRALAAQGYRPGVVSRGYGGRPQRVPARVTADSDPADCGDEAILIARRTGALVRVSPDRVAAAQAVVRDGANVVVADDGLQHYRLARQLEIAVLDGHRGLGNRRLLPAGPLREPPARLDEADVVLVNGGGDPDRGLGFRLRAGQAINLQSGARMPVTELRGRTVWVVAGIGNPARFVEQLAADGILAESVAVPDHGRVDLHALIARARRPILMTEKDAVKYRSPPPDAWYIPVSAEMSPEAEHALHVALGRVLS